MGLLCFIRNYNIRNLNKKQREKAVGKQGPISSDKMISKESVLLCEFRLLFFQVLDDDEYKAGLLVLGDDVFLSLGLESQQQHGPLISSPLY